MNWLDGEGPVDDLEAAKARAKASRSVEPEPEDDAVTAADLDDPDQQEGASQ